MDRQLRERLVGAGVLVLLLVVVVPWVLDGGTDDESGSGSEVNPAEPAAVKEPRRTHTIRLDQSTERPPVAREMSEPEKPPSSSAGRVGTVEPKSDNPVKSEPVATAKPKAPVSAPAKPKPKPVKTASTQSKPAPTKSAETKPAQSKSAKSTPIPTEGWVVQLGSFSSKPNAQRLTDEVSARGFPAFMMPLQRSGKTLYRVRVGPRKTREQAADLAGKLVKVGYTGQVTRQ